MKKILSIFMALVMALSICAVSVSAAEDYSEIFAMKAEWVWRYCRYFAENEIPNDDLGIIYISGGQSLDEAKYDEEIHMLVCPAQILGDAIKKTFANGNAIFEDMKRDDYECYYRPETDTFAYYGFTSIGNIPAYYTFVGYNTLGNGRYEIWSTIQSLKDGKEDELSGMKTIVNYDGDAVQFVSNEKTDINDVPTQFGDKTESEAKPEGTAYNKTFGNVKVSAAAGVFASDVTVTVTEVKDKQTTAAVTTALKDVSETFVVYDITAMRGGKETQPNGKVKVTFAIPDDFTGNVAVYRITDKAEKLSTTVDKTAKTATVELDHFSTYALVNSKAADQPAASNPTGTENPTSPKTGDNSPSVLFAVIAILSLAAIIVLMKIRANKI